MIDDNSILEMHKKQHKHKENQSLDRSKSILTEDTKQLGFSNIHEDIKDDNVIRITNDEQLMSILMSRKKPSSITYSQRMLKKADNLTKFNRKNHSEGNKHITNHEL